MQGHELGLLLLVIFVTGCLCRDAIITVKLPDDENFRKYSIAYLTIDTLPKIDSVRSTMKQPANIDVDKSTDPHRIIFRPDMPTGVDHLRVTVGSTEYELHLIVERLPNTTINNCVFLTGPSANMKNLLTSLKSQRSIRLISLKSVSKSITEAVVQVYKADTLHFLPLWDAYEWMTKNVDASTQIELMPDRCPASPAQLCRCRLVFSRGRPSVHSAVVTLGNTEVIENFIGLDLSWEPQTAAQMHLEPCGPGTCLNGGVCDPSFIGVGFRCNCPSKPNTPWGPRCEYPIRSYYSNHRIVEPVSYTQHWIGNFPHSASFLELSFELSGLMETSNEVFVLKSSSNKGNPLLSLSPLIAQTVMRISGSMLGGKKLDVQIDQLNYNMWNVIHILLKPTIMHFVACPKNFHGLTSLECFTLRQTTSAGNSIDSDFQNYWLEIGAGLYGCVQSVSINGYILDMTPGKAVTNNASRITDRCNHQTAACTYKYSSSTSYNYACGNNSVCYGELSEISSYPMNCNCKCLGSKRSKSETVTASGVCKNKYSCSKDPLILNTVSANVSRWVLNGNRSLSLSEETTMSIEIELRTRNDKASGILTGLVRNSRGSQILLQRLDISNGMLLLCIDSFSCCQFPPIKVNDGEWHAVSAIIRHDLLRLTVDGVSTMYDRGAVPVGFKTLELSSAIANSNLRNIRVSDTYMSTNNDTDRAVDSTGDSVVPILAADITVGNVTLNPAPLCEDIDCPRNERCLRVWGKTTCECVEGQVRDHDRICIDSNPCTKYKIECPTRSECRNASGYPGFQCVCQTGVINDLCITKDFKTVVV